MARVPPILLVVPGIMAGIFLPAVIVGNPKPTPPNTVGMSFMDFTKDVVTPAAKEKKLTTTAQVVGAAVSELHPNSAVVLLFVNQATVSKDRPDPAMAASTVLVSLAKVHGKWLITKFDPI